MDIYMISSIVYLRKKNIFFGQFRSMRDNAHNPANEKFLINKISPEEESWKFIRISNIFESRGV